MTPAPGVADVRPGEVTIYIGGVSASAEPVTIRTLLGSCISVCLWDPVRRVGGMNHFMLPHGAQRDDADATRFGVHAMDRLIGAMMKLGADRRRLVAKVFGGAHVLGIAESPGGVPQRNIEFAREFLAREALPVVGEDTGGYEPRHVKFQTYTGRALMRRVAPTAMRQRLAAAEARTARAAPSYGEVTLWD